MTLKNSPIALVTLLLVAPAVASADLYEYTTEDGVLSFTDSPKSIPSKYQGRAHPRQEESLWSYERVTEVAPGATTAPSSTWAAALEDEDEAEVEDQDEMYERGGAPGVLVNVGGGVTLAAGACPDDVIYVESSLYDNEGFIEDSNYYGPTRRIYCGDRLIAFIR